MITLGYPDTYTSAPARKVLLIDDEPDIRAVTGLALEVTTGWVVTEADDGATGIRLARACPPDLILLDIMMPEMDGFETISILHADPVTRPVPVVFLSAKSTADLRSRTKSAGARGIIPKPFDPMSIGRELATILGW